MVWFSSTAVRILTFLGKIDHKVLLLESPWKEGPAVIEILKIGQAVVEL